MKIFSYCAAKRCSFSLFYNFHLHTIESFKCSLKMHQPATQYLLHTSSIFLLMSLSCSQSLLLGSFLRFLNLSLILHHYCLYFRRSYVVCLLFYLWYVVPVLLFYSAINENIKSICVRKEVIFLN